MKLYVASSWRCSYYPRVIELAQQTGHEVYDFRNPGPGARGFGWHEIDPSWRDWQPRVFRERLNHPLATQAFDSDMTALRNCDACLCVLPCNRSAHLELGWAAGAGKYTAIYMPEPTEPELTYSLVDELLCSEEELLSWLKLSSMIITELTSHRRKIE